MNNLKLQFVEEIVFRIFNYTMYIFKVDLFNSFCYACTYTGHFYSHVKILCRLHSGTVLYHCKQKSRAMSFKVADSNFFLRILC